MLNHLAPTTGERHVSHIKLLGDCTRCHDVCFCQRPGGGISLAEPRISSAQPPGQPMDLRTEGCGGTRCKDHNGTSRDAGAHPDQGQEITPAGPVGDTRTAKAACRERRLPSPRRREPAWRRGHGHGALGTSAARQFGEEIPDRDRRIQILACERHGVAAVLHRVQHDHRGAVFHKGHAVD
jgi:hypothetical protein